MDNITINIDGKEIQTQEGEFILEAARANDIFIPAICYLTRCSPTLACRICLVEADGKQVYLSLYTSPSPRDRTRYRMPSSA
jgi:NADH-quinone oxidoreductase subunit G